MRKHNEGYALPFVLVVLVVLSIITVGIMEFSLRNFKSQQNTILRLEAKYEAAGEIEKIVAAAENNVTGASFNSTEKLLFCLDNNTKYLRIAAASGDIWIIAELKPKNADGDITTTFGTNGNSKTLTINGNDTKVIEYVKYQLVDENTAWSFVGHTPDDPEESMPSEPQAPSEPAVASEPVGGVS